MKSIPRYGLAAVLTVWAACALAQPDATLGGYTSMEVEAGRMKGNFATGAIEEMTGGVRIRLLSDDPDLAPLPIRAQTMEFTWTEGRTTPDKIIMDKDVEVRHPDAVIKAGRAEWNFDTGELLFTGNPVVDSPQLKGLRGEWILMNLKNNTFEVSQMRADEVPLQAPADDVPESPDVLSMEDVKNWPLLLDAIKAQNVAGGASPGSTIIGHLSMQNRQMLLTGDTPTLIESKEDILRLINGVLARHMIYDAEAWAGVVLPEEAQQLIAARASNPDDVRRLNRLLIEAAYPGAFVAP